MKKTLTVALPGREYQIEIQRGLLDQAGERCRALLPRARKLAVVTDSNVLPLYLERTADSLKRAGFQVLCCSVPAGEAAKCPEQLVLLWEKMMSFGMTRTDGVAALGGGVVGDLAGFAAATLLRGVDFIQIPTTLLAQVDSSVGGKVAIDLQAGKNLAGAFWQPKGVLIDPDCLNTLSDRAFSDGMAEVIKYGCIKDADLFSTLESHSSFEDLKEELPAIITRCVDIKRMVVENDQFDTGERMLLNFGHTLAHTIEQHFHYQRESHGEAVAIGMYQITMIAEEKGLTPKGTADRIQQVLKTYGLPFECGLTLGTLTEAIALDKKNLNGNLNVILLHEIGNSYIEATDIQFFAETARLV